MDLRNVGLFSLSEMMVAYVRKYGSLKASSVSPAHVPFKGMIEHAQTCWDKERTKRNVSDPVERHRNVRIDYLKKRIVERRELYTEKRHQYGFDINKIQGND